MNKYIPFLPTKHKIVQYKEIGVASRDQPFTIPSLPFYFFSPCLALMPINETHYNFKLSSCVCVVFLRLFSFTLPRRFSPSVENAQWPVPWTAR